MTCRSCDSNSGLARISPGPAILEGRFWVVEHAYPASLLGWVVIVLRRHAEALHELTSEEFAELALVQARLFPALFLMLNCEKEYVACYGELEGFRHIHFHVVPKPPGLSSEFVGSKSFAFLKVSEADAVPKDQVKAFCEELRAKLSGSSERSGTEI